MQLKLTIIVKDGLPMQHQLWPNSGTQSLKCLSTFNCNKEDSIPGIYDTLKQCAQISQSAGGIGLSIRY